MNQPNTTVKPLNKDTFGNSRFSFVERLSSFRGDFLLSVYTRVLLTRSLLGGLSSFGVLLRNPFPYFVLVYKQDLTTGCLMDQALACCVYLHKYFLKL